MPYRAVLNRQRISLWFDPQLVVTKTWFDCPIRVRQIGCGQSTMECNTTYWLRRGDTSRWNSSQLSPYYSYCWQLCIRPWSSKRNEVFHFDVHAHDWQFNLWWHHKQESPIPSKRQSEATPLSCPLIKTSYADAINLFISLELASMECQYLQFYLWFLCMGSKHLPHLFWSNCCFHPTKPRSCRPMKVPLKWLGNRWLLTQIYSPLTVHRKWRASSPS